MNNELNTRVTVVILSFYALRRFLFMHDLCVMCEMCDIRGCREPRAYCGCLKHSISCATSVANESGTVLAHVTGS